MGGATDDREFLKTLNISYCKYPISLNYSTFIFKKPEVDIFFPPAFQIFCFNMAGIEGNHGGVLSLESLASNVFLRKVLYKATPETAEAVREIVDQILIGKVKKSAR